MLLSNSLIDQILDRLPSLTIGVLGDLFLDQYLFCDGSLTEPSIETGLDAYQVTKIVNSPGAAGTVLNNLVGLHVGKVKIVSFIGTDGRGYDLKQELIKRKVDLSYLLETPFRLTPTYTKPMLATSKDTAGQFRELNRIDIKNRTATPSSVEDFFLQSLAKLWQEVDALIVLDQVSEANCGVVTERVRHELAKLGESEPTKLLLADSRENIGSFQNCWTKPNLQECRRAIGMLDGSETDQALAVATLAIQTCRPVFCTNGEQGILLAEAASTEPSKVQHIPCYPVSGPIDPVGAGDSTSAGIVCGYAAGANLSQATAFGNLVASITVQQIGTTGIATPELVRARWKEVSS
jgi:rfaE bifunctional protein kinase chain/domain